MKEFIEWLAGLQTALLIEFVERDDEMVEGLLRNRDDQYFDYNPTCFERYLNECFLVKRREVLASDTRTLYFVEAKQ